MREPEAGTEERGRYDLYIVSENLQQEREQEEQEETGGHTNQSFALSEPEEENEEGEEGEINYTALSRATTAIVSLIAMFLPCTA